MSEPAPERKPNEMYEFLKNPIRADQDGITCVVIHERAQTELGRLLCVNANVPFNIYAKGNPKSDSGEWGSFAEGVINAGNDQQARWVQDYFLPDRNSVMTQKDKNELMSWMNWKIQQNWYLLDLLVREKLPIVFVKQQYQTDEQGSKIYTPMPSFEFLQHSIRNLKNSTRLKWNREKGKDEKRETKRVLKGKPPVARQQPYRKENEGSKPQRKRD